MTAEELYQAGKDAYAPEDYGKAMEYYQFAGEPGNAEGWRGIGSLYQDGLGVEQDYSKAYDRWRHAAEQGEAASMYALGECYRMEQGVEKNPEKAAEWYRNNLLKNSRDFISLLSSSFPFIFTGTEKLVFFFEIMLYDNTRMFLNPVCRFGNLPEQPQHKGRSSAAKGGKDEKAYSASDADLSDPACRFFCLRADGPGVLYEQQDGDSCKP